MNVSDQPVVVELDRVHKRYGDSVVLKDVSLRVREGDIVAVVGPSGAGKSTLLRLVNQLEHHQDGELRIDGEAVAPDAGPAALAALRVKVGMVFQSFNLWPHFSAIENVMEGPRTVLKLPRAEARSRAAELLARVGLDGLHDRYPSQLSGGQQQRVAIARALAMRPRVMLFDEATSALDPSLVNDVLEVMTALAAQRMTMLVVTHEMRFAREVADRIVFMADGEILEEAPPEDFFTRPQHPRARAFVASVSSQRLEGSPA
jgi:glutamate transport system ATP-binding protein